MTYTGEIWALDLDRVLLDTEATFDLLTEVCAKQDIDEHLLGHAKEETESSGGSFDAISYLKTGQAGPVDIHRLLRDFVAGGSSERLLYPDAINFLQSIDSNHIQHLIMTYGAVDFQEAKLRAAGQAYRPYIINDNQRKGDTIAGWATAKGYEVMDSIGRLIVGRIVNAAEDKAVGLQGLPLDCRGYYIQRPNEAIRPSQDGDIGPNVEICHSLNDLTSLLYTHSAF